LQKKVVVGKEFLAVAGGCDVELTKTLEAKEEVEDDDIGESRKKKLCITTKSINEKTWFMERNNTKARTTKSENRECRER
jgi:hypothetical protein